MRGLVFVDTSVWIEALKGRSAALRTRLQGLLDEDRAALSAPVRIEILSVASRDDFRRLSEDLSALPIFYPTAETWALIERWVEAAVRSGERFGMGDLLIGAIAAENEGEVWSLDSDFGRLAALGVIRLLEASSPPAG